MLNKLRAKLGLGLAFKGFYDAVTSEKGTPMGTYSATKTVVKAVIFFLLTMFPQIFAGTGLSDLVLPDTLQQFSGAADGILGSVLVTGWYAFNNWKKNKDKGKATTSNA